jgi:hypothetical protein
MPTHAKSRFGFVALLFAAMLWPAMPATQAAETAGESVLVVTHAHTGTTLVTANTDGHQLGDTRVVSLATRDDSGTAGRLDSVLITTGIDVPGPGDEVRISHLVFTFGSPSDQIYVGGSAVYPGKGSTIAVATSVTRPILGGSGKYGGASGWCETVHLSDGSWTHTFHLTAGSVAR